jgi:RNA polymerase sigma-70 factor (ECF subfamily)
MKYIKDNSKLKLLLDDETVDSLPEEKTYLIPEDNFMHKELCSEIMTYMYELPKLQRITLILYYYNNLSIKEIASVMSCSEGTVKARLFRGKKNLKILLDYKNKNEVNMYGFRTIN